jgi:hypothetical protein
MLEKILLDLPFVPEVKIVVKKNRELPKVPFLKFLKH